MHRSESSLLALAISTKLHYSYLLLSLVLSLLQFPLLRSSFYLPLSSTSGSNHLFSTIRLQMVLDHSLLPGNGKTNELAMRVRYSSQPLSHVVSLVSTLPLDWKRSFRSKFFKTQAASVSTENLVIPPYARCVLCRLRCNGHSLVLNSYLSRICRIESPSCRAYGYLTQDTSSHSALCYYVLSAPLACWRLLLSQQPLVQALKNCRLLGLHDQLPCPQR